MLLFFGLFSNKRVELSLFFGCFLRASLALHARLVFVGLDVFRELFLLLGLEIRSKGVDGCSQVGVQRPEAIQGLRAYLRITRVGCRFDAR